MGAVLDADGELWDGADLWRDDYPLERDLTPEQLDRFRAALDQARVADLNERREEFDDDFPPEEYPDLSIDQDLSDVDLTTIPPSAAEAVAKYDYDRATWARDRARRRRGPAPDTEAPERARLGPMPYVAPTRETGVITGDMSELQLLTEVTMGGRFPGPAGAQWLFDSTSGNQIVIPYGSSLPVGASVLDEDREREGYVIDESRDVFLVAPGEPLPFGAETVETDDAGAWVRASGAKLMFRFDESGALLGSEHGPAGGQKPVSVMLVSHHVSDGVHVTTAVMIDVDTGRVFDTGTSRRPTMAESIPEAIGGIENVVSSWHHDASDPRHPTNRANLRRFQFPPVTSSDQPDAAPNGMPTWVKPVMALAGLAALVAGAVFALGGDDGTESATQPAPASVEPATNDEDEPAISDGDQPGPSASSEPPDPAANAPDQRPVAGPPELIGEIGGPGDTGIRVERDPEGGLSWSIVGTDGRQLAASEIVEFFAVVAAYPQAALDRIANRSSYPCGAITDDYRVTCPLGAALLGEGEYFVVGAKHAGPVAQGAATFTYGLAFDDDADDSDNYQFAPPFNADFFRNSEHWYRLHVDADGERTMWADGARDGVLGYPRFSSAMAIEFGDTLFWIVPRSEVPGDHPAFRLTAFHNDGDPMAVPDPATSGGDVSGLDVTEALIPIALEAIVFDDLAALPPDIDDPTPRVEAPADPDRAIADALVTDFSDRLNAALTADDDDAVGATLMPGLLSGPNGVRCQATVDETISQADSVDLAAATGPPDTSTNRPIYAAQATINYPTGSVEWIAPLLPGPQGRLYLVLQQCLQP
jgi:hypothetical protein